MSMIEEMWEKFTKTGVPGPKTCFFAGAGASLRQLYDLPEDTPIEVGAEKMKQMEEEAQAHMVEVELEASEEELCMRCKKRPAHTYSYCVECHNEIIESHEGKLDHKRKGEHEV